MGAGSFSITLDRQFAVDFTSGFFEEPMRILIPPPDEAPRLFACVRPFQNEVRLHNLKQNRFHRDFFSEIEYNKRTVFALCRYGSAYCALLFFCQYLFI